MGRQKEELAILRAQLAAAQAENVDLQARLAAEQTERDARVAQLVAENVRECQRAEAAEKECERFRKGRRVALCIWCGEEIASITDNPTREFLEQMQQHDLGCKNNPIAKALAAAQAELSHRIECEAGHPNMCCGQCSQQIEAAETALAAAQAENVQLHDRLRKTTRILIDEVGANGPCNAEDAATRSVIRIKSLRSLLAQANAGAAERSPPSTAKME
jgi:hypothetical protein